MLINERRDRAKPRRIWAYSRPYGPFIRRNWAANWANFGAWGRAGGGDWAKNRPQRRVSRRLAPKGRFLCVLGGPAAGDALSATTPPWVVTTPDSNFSWQVGYGHELGNT